MTTKIVALADALGNLVRFVLLPGQRFDTVGVPPLIEGIAFGCTVPGCGGTMDHHAARDALWAKFSTAAPARQRLSVARSSYVKGA